MFKNKIEELEHELELARLQKREAQERIDELTTKINEEESNIISTIAYKLKGGK